MRHRTLGVRAWLLLSAVYLLLVALIALEVPLGLSVRHRLVEEFKSIELGYSGLLAQQVADPVASAAAAGAVAPQPARELTDAVARLHARVPAARVLIVDARRRVLVDTSGEVTPGTGLDTAERPELADALRGSIASAQRFSNTAGHELLLVSVPVFDGGSVVGAVRISQTLAEVDASVRRVWVGLLGVGLAALLVGSALAWLLAAALARPVHRLQAAAGQLRQGDLDARAEPRGPEEVAALARSFNRMAQAIAANSKAQQDFVANASHQLRTPLTGLRLRLEAIEAEGGPAAEQAMKAQVEVGRLASLVGDLLTLARASSVEPQGRPVDLSEAGRQAAERWAQTAARSGKRVTHRAGGPVPIRADPGDVDQIVDNLVENAIRYCPDEAEITVRSDTLDGRALLLVSDNGPGIPGQEQERVFERFYRGANGRQTGPGTGLGLAIVAQFAARWGGTARLVPIETGTCVEVAFPAEPTVS